MSYTYTPLNPTLKQIRLITILPGPRGSPLNCTIQIVNLSSNPQYEALSYEWGPPTSTGVILLDEISFPVRENLLLALLYLRSTKTSKVFWIDAICINQSDIQERNSQVEMMGDIYRSASLVRAWLGAPETAIIADAFTLLHRFKRSHSGSQSSKSKSRSKQVHKLSKQEREALAAFTSLTYWSRIWIVQELVLAKEIVFHCGHENAVWWPLLLTSLRLAGFLHSPAGLILSLRDRRRRNTLLGLMRNCFASRATDRRDLVFALLGIADDVGGVSEGVIRVDYTIKVEDLMAQVDGLYREQELRSAPALWAALGRRSEGEGGDVCDTDVDAELGFSRYLRSYFHQPDVFARIEQTRVLATSTSYGTSAVRERLGGLVVDLERIEKSDARRVDSGIGMED